jgi:hypothetical protein
MGLRQTLWHRVSRLGVIDIAYLGVDSGTFREPPRSGRWAPCHLPGRPL